MALQPSHATGGGHTGIRLPYLDAVTDRRLLDALALRVVALRSSRLGLGILLGNGYLPMVNWVTLPLAFTLQ